jgi:hypothetical protein
MLENRPAAARRPGSFDIEIFDLELFHVERFELEGTVSPGLSGVP